MNKLYLLAAAAVTGLSMQAVSVLPLSEMNRDFSSLPAYTSAGKPVCPLNVKPLTPTRSAETPETEFIASEASFFSYGDAFGNGTCVYYLFLSTAGINKGNPTHDGQMMRVMLVGDAVEEGATPALPTGTYTGDLTNAAGTFVLDSTDCLDVFYNPDDPESGELVGYIFLADDGTATISEENGIYTIDVEFTGVEYDDYGNPLGSATCRTQFTGKVSYEDLYAYTPLDGDLDITLTGASGRYLDGDYSIAFYTVPLDEDGFIIGAGELLNLELFTERSNPMNLDEIVGTFSTTCDPFSEGQVPGTFMEGIWYEYWSGYYVPLGTAITIYDASGYDTNVGLAESGTITITRDGDDYTFDFDLVTKEGDRVKAVWSGPIAQYVEDYSVPDPNSVESIDAAPGMIKAGKGFIETPAGAAVYDMTGARVASEGLAPGVYLVRHEGKTSKVMVR